MIDLRNTETFKNLDNDGQDWHNRLTVFGDGEARIEEIHSSNRNSISIMEFNGQAVSIKLPNSISTDDLYRIADAVLPIADKPWEPELTEEGEVYKSARERVKDELESIQFYEIIEGINETD